MAKNIQLPPALEEYRLARNGDPKTSIIAAQKASKASAKAIEAVAKVVQGEEGLLDEDIWQACRANGYFVTQDTIEHARLALAEAGFLRDTGHTRNTTNGSPARIWVWEGSKWWKKKEEEANGPL